MKRIAKKDYMCDACGVILPKGSSYNYGEGRFARYDDNDKQIGISFGKWHLHDYNCTIPEDCRNDVKHEYEYSAANPDNWWEESGNFCKFCGKKDKTQP